jgi:hypothetical protein
LKAGVYKFPIDRFKIVEIRFDGGSEKLTKGSLRSFPFEIVESVINSNGLTVWNLISDKADFEILRKKRPREVKFENVERIKLPKQRRQKLSDDFLNLVSDFYRQAVELGEFPIVALSEDAGVSYKTAESWARKARARGFLSRGDAGKVS